MGFIKQIIENRQKKINSINDLCDEYILRIDTAIKDANNLFINKSDFINPEAFTEWCQKHGELFEIINEKHIKLIKKARSYKVLLDKETRFINCYKKLKSEIEKHNNAVAEDKAKAAYKIIGKVEGRLLDKQQMACIVKDTHNHLVIAGAGTGKTTTIVGKIKYILKTEKFKPKDILVLSFTNASATEMSERINRETGCNIAASTFHKLGLNIITKVNGIVPKIASWEQKSFIKEQLLLNMESKSYLQLLSTYLLYNRVVSKSEFEFKTQAEYDEYLRLNPPVTVKNEIVKSYGEMDIANFLTQNGIEYIYECPYKIDTRDSNYGQYKPDFYLPEYDIYIEYFGINHKGEVPSYFVGSNGMTATQAYQASMQWKRETHKNNNTVMIECFAYEKFDGRLLESLKSKLESRAVVLKPKSPKELWEEISAEENNILDGIIDLFGTVINLIKSNGYSFEQVRQLNNNNSNFRTNSIILNLIEPIFNAYCSRLKENDEIDFNDMINLATQYVEQGKYLNPYKMVIVDEYQDISKARFSLLNSMRKSNNFDLFCVGDDWQSIYRFAGSDIGFILNFEHFWGPTETSKIETTYRFSQNLIGITGYFVMKNPSQIKKSIVGKSFSVGFPLGEISGYTEKYAVEFMLKRLDDLPKNSTVFFIGRYSFDSKILDESKLLSIQYNNVTKLVDVKYSRRPDLKMNFITAHKSKGLQADFVFIINNKKSRMGFPSKVQDAAILDLLLEGSDRYPYAEERRLFYVAMTRAKQKVFMLTVNGKESEFVNELKETYGDELKAERFTCPLCGGRLVKRSGQYGEFWGCENYSTIRCTYKRKTK